MARIIMVSSFLLLGLSVLSTTMVKCSLVPGLYAFGDSLFDNGNNNFLPTIAKANFLPYGNNFVDQRQFPPAKGPTGRFTNGRNVVDFIAEYLDLPYPPPFLSHRKTSIITGFNFASGVCGILPETGSTYGKCLNLDDQVTLFNITTSSDLAKQFNGLDSLSNHLSKSIFAISVGNNDYINNYLDTTLFRTSDIYTPQQFANLLVEKLSYQLQRLYDLGARKFVVFEIGPIGCMPWITRQTRHDGLCVEEVNKLVSYFNADLQNMLKNKTSTLPDSMFVLGQVNSLGYDAIVNPTKYGLLDSSNPCCEALFNGTSLCIPLSLPCSNVNKHFFWDGFHQTEPVYSLVASRCISDASVCSPVNIKDLVAM